MKRKNYFSLLSCMLGALLFGNTLFPTLTVTAQEETKAGSTAEYRNEETNELRTIFWADGITPPKMGGDDSDFKKTEHKTGNAHYVEYIAPYKAGNGWYDINKTDTQAQDANLCFAAVATNMLHWWIAQNTDNIKEYLTLHPDAPRADEIRKFLTPVTSQEERSIYNIFLRQYANRKEGYWPDLLEDQFINGYYPKETGGTNDPDFDGSDLIQKGPDSNGGFFYNVFRTEILTNRHQYDRGYSSLSTDLKHYITRGDLISLTYDTGKSAHVVTVWGVEYNKDGHLTGVYFSDSDDDKANGMQRYSVLNKNGHARVTTDTTGNVNGSLVSCITVLSTGETAWKQFLSPQPTELNLLWGETNFIYDGTSKKPELSASNIRPGDDVTLTVKGEASLVGTYTATASLSGKDSGRYALSADAEKTFTIQPSQTIFNGGLKSFCDGTETTNFAYGDIITITVTPKATGLSPDAAENPKVLLSPTNGQMALFFGDHQLSAFVNADTSGTYTLTYQTASGILSPGACTLTAAFRGDTNMVDHSENITVQLTGDNYISVDFLAPTCETDGIKAHYKDKDGKLFINENGIMKEVTFQDLVLSATGHQPGAWIQDHDKHYQECLNGCGQHLHEGNCTGGSAIFPDRAVCDICGHPYGAYPEEPETDIPDPDVPENDSPAPDVPENDSPDSEKPNPNVPDGTTPDDETSGDGTSDEELPSPEAFTPQLPSSEALAATSQSASEKVSEKAVETGDTAPMKLLFLTLLSSGLISMSIYRFKKNML